jgi:serine phosphatase RsbU (regulator of sigma subunit)
VNAGHQPALIVRADGSAQALASSGVPLGLMETAAYTAADATLDRATPC